MKKPVVYFILMFLPFFVQSADYYWIGGSGNWSDITHWAAASGGTVTYAQAPGPDDNVIFDSNSFPGPNQTVILNTDIAFFQNMDWTAVTNNPTFEGSSSRTLNIFGSLNLSPNMSFNFEGTTRFLGSETDLEIDYASHEAGLLVVFDGSGGWQLMNEMSVDSTLSIRQGSFRTNDHSISSRFFYIEGPGDKMVELDASVITLSGSFLDTYRNDDDDIKTLSIQATNLIMDAGSSLIDMTAENAAFWFIGDGSVALNEVSFSSTMGTARLSDSYYFNNLTFNTLSAASSTTFLANFDTEMLILSGGNVYEFQANETYDIGSILGDGDCARGVIMTSTETGSAANIQGQSGAINLSFVTLRDIHISGGGTFTASEGVDLGNNDGWTFTNSMSRDFYWIGGSGNWTDPMHWSFSSGGPSSGCVPTGNDDVFFDVNSFNGANQSVTIDRPNVYMHDMTWEGITNNGGLAGDLNFRIRITGSLKFDANMEHTFGGFYHFESAASGNTIETNGIMFNRELFFSGLTGEWTFLDDVELVWQLNFRSGTLNTNGQQVTALAVISRTTVPRMLNIEGSHFILRPVDYHQPHWEVENEGYQVSGMDSKIEFTAHSGSFNHYGHASTPTQNYDTVQFSTNESYLGSNNWFTDENVPGVIIDHMIYRGDGYIDGSNHFRKLELAGGHYYQFDGNGQRRQIVDDLVTESDCADGMTQLFSTVRSDQASISINQDYTLERMEMTDIRFNGGMVMSNNSIDGGNNTNATFTEMGPRTLYWVGDGGFWQDPMHWSLSSGGPGGECIPTSIDDVIFDANSFSMPGQEVDSYGTRYRNCHDITWTGTTNQPSFVNWYINPTGSVTYDQSFNNYTWRTVMLGDDIQTVTADGQMFNWIELKNLGEVQFLDDLSLYYLVQSSGTFSFQDINVRTDRMHFDFNVPKTANFGNSHITIFGEGDFYNPPLSIYSEEVTINPGNSSIEFTGSQTGFQDFSEVSFHNVVFSNPASFGRIINLREWEDQSLQRTTEMNSLVFTCDAETTGNFVTDSLIGAAGKTYVFDANRDVAIDSYLQMTGNNCTPIEMRSNEVGQKARMTMPSTGRVIADFVQMQDMQGIGGADFNAGARSTDIGNSNIGWIFEDTPDFVESGFLGVDRALCTGQDLILDAYSFSPNEVYNWSDGSSDSILTVDQPGVYFVQVEFESSCILRDTIEIFTALDVMAMLPEDEMICEGTMLTIDAAVPIATATYLWNTGENSASIAVDQEGQYYVDIDVDGCVSSDTIQVMVISDPGLDLGNDRSVCEGESFTLDAGVIADSYLWQDGSFMNSITSEQGGIFKLDISVNNCTFTDSVMISITPRPEVILDVPLTVCDVDSFMLTIPNPDGFSITWHDGTVGEQILVDQTETYIATVDDNGCVSTGSIFIDVNEALIPNLGDDINICEGEEAVLLPGVNADSYLWSEGSNSSSIVINPVATTPFSVTITDVNGCSASDEILVSVQSAPNLELGRDTTVCDDSPFILSPLTRSAGSLLWSDGSGADQLTVNSPGLIRATLTEGNCTSSDSIQISFKECVFFNAFIPNAFSPNEDGINDRLEISFPEGLVVNSFDINVFDRWGNRVFTSNSLEDSWDGRWNSDILDTGVYIYVVNVDYVDDLGPGSRRISGDVTIIN